MSNIDTNARFFFKVNFPCAHHEKIKYWGVVDKVLAINFFLFRLFSEIYYYSINNRKSKLLSGKNSQNQ